MINQAKSQEKNQKADFIHQEYVRFKDYSELNEKKQSVSAADLHLVSGSQLAMASARVSRVQKNNGNQPNQMNKFI